jgi:hypothetical protein
LIESCDPDDDVPLDPEQPASSSEAVVREAPARSLERTGDMVLLGKRGAEAGVRTVNDPWCRRNRRAAVKSLFLLF